MNTPLFTYYKSRFLNSRAEKELCLTNKCSSHQRPAIVTKPSGQTMLNPSLQSSILQMQQSSLTDSIDKKENSPSRSTPLPKSSATSCSVSLHASKLCEDH